MRSSERWAVGAVAAMTAPAFLAFPILGLWYVARVWPGMSGFDRGLFCCALALFCWGVPYGFRRSVKRVEMGRHPGLSPLERTLLAVPILAGGWALTHRLDIVLSMSVVGLWDLYRAYRRQQDPPPGSADRFSSHERRRPSA